MHDANNTNPIIADRPNGASNVGAVAAVIHRVAVLAIKIVAVNIVNKAIAVVVNLIAGHFSFVYPHVCRKVGMGIVHACVNNANDDIARSDRDVPGVFCRDPCQPPEPIKVRVIGRGCRASRAIGSLR